MRKLKEKTPRWLYIVIIAVTIGILIVSLMLLCSFLGYVLFGPAIT